MDRLSISLYNFLHQQSSILSYAFSSLVQIPLSPPYSCFAPHLFQLASPRSQACSVSHPNSSHRHFPSPSPLPSCPCVPLPQKPSVPHSSHCPFYSQPPSLCLWQTPRNGTALSSSPIDLRHSFGIGYRYFPGACNLIVTAVFVVGFYLRFVFCGPVGHVACYRCFGLSWSRYVRCFSVVLRFFYHLFLRCPFVDYLRWTKAKVFSSFLLLVEKRLEKKSSHSNVICKTSSKENVQTSYQIYLPLDVTKQQCPFLSVGGRGLFAKL